MAQTINAGRDFSIYLVSAVTGSDASFSVTTGYTPNGTGASGNYPLQQVMTANTCVIHARSASDLQLRKFQNDANYITIPSGTMFEFKINPTQTQVLFWLRAVQTNTTAEILVYAE